MKWIKLTPTRTKNRDLDFLVKAPVLPNRFWFEKHSYSIAIFKPSKEGEAYFLKTDHDAFLKAFDEYYRDRFEVQELEGSQQLPNDYTTLVQYGSESETTTNSTSEEEVGEEDEVEETETQSTT